MEVTCSVLFSSSFIVDLLWSGFVLNYVYKNNKMHILNIVSLNVNGLTTPRKIGKVIQKLRKEKVQFALLQDTHLHDEEHEKQKKMGFRNTYTIL